MKILVALGGNAILKPTEKGTEAEQLLNVRASSNQLANLVKQGHQISITHGNGPQVGDIVLLYELAKRKLPPMPLDVCGAQSQGMIGYLFQQSMDDALREKGVTVPTVTLLTQTVVDKDDPAMQNPSKPIGPFYSEKEAQETKQEKGWQVKQDGTRGYRRFVPSPEPKEVVEAGMIRQLFELGYVVIHSGGGGIPVVRDQDGSLRGIEAVIDKDLTASLMASLLEVDVFLILTDVEKVFLNFGTENQVGIDRLTINECVKYQKQGQFGTGSMAPKIEAARRFVFSSRKKTIITSLDTVMRALNGKSGTTITYD